MTVRPIEAPVLVAADLSEGADEALRQADALARSLRVPLHVCHVMPELLRVRMLFPQLQLQDAADLQALERRANQMITVRVGVLTGRRPEEYSLEITSGSPHSGILETAERLRPGLLVVGPGGVAERVARHAPCPVLVARPSPRGKVLGATDFSDPALPAVEAAVREAARRRTTPCLLHSIDWIPTVSAGFPTGVALPAVPRDLLEDLRGTARKQLEGSLQRLGAEGECFVGEGHAATAILRLARELPAELVVVGTRGRTGLARLALGSVAEAVLSMAPCSVLVVRLHES
jgi:nucleotide-binding universal stress UspA family protein